MPPKEGKVCTYCLYCFHDIFVGDYITKFSNGDIVHDSCKGDYINENFIELDGIITESGEIE